MDDNARFLCARKFLDLQNDLLLENILVKSVNIYISEH